MRRYDFLPFGEELKAGLGGRGADYEPSTYTYPTTPDDVTRKFTGKERDSETGLDYFGARYFSAAQGRFTSADWAAKPEAVPYANLEDPQTLNLYGYVRNNPLAKSDKDGHGELQPLDSQQMQSVQSDMAALNQFTVEHPILTNLLLNVGMAILSRGEAGPGGRVESSEGTGGGVPEAPTMRSGQREPCARRIFRLVNNRLRKQIRQRDGSMNMRFRSQAGVRQQKLFNAIMVRIAVTLASCTLRLALPSPESRLLRIASVGPGSIPTRPK